MGSLPKSPYSPTSHHINMLQQVVDDEIKATNSIIHSYKRSFNGFAAMLTDQQREKLSQMEGVVSVFPSRTLQLHTTRSWDFIGLPQSTKQSQTAESDSIIGVLDTGIWPESESFSDKGFGPIPKKWKGTCAGGKNFTCNNKIIGARFYADDSARDTNGHGTHTASTAAGNNVHNVSFYGIAQGIARGGVPLARVAAYKVCNENGCQVADILAAFDDAIADGVDIISISIGGFFARNFDEDGIAIGSFHAMQKGVLTVNSAGNDGPDIGGIQSVAPWILSVGASTIDRQFISKVILGNGKTLTGKSINTVMSNGTKSPIAKQNGGSKTCEKLIADDCYCLDSDLVKGKVVLCGKNTNGAFVAYDNGAIGAIIKLSSENDIVYVTPVPSVGLNSDDYALVESYKSSTRDPKLEILKGETIVDHTAPIMADFSSRGPNAIVPEILKPDVTAPGVEILAAYSPIATLKDNRSVQYNIISGTSMSCPHVAGIAAYLKTFHLDWSPAAIKSAIMTSAQPLNGTKDHVGEFAYGSGHVNPIQAVNPGLVYDIGKEDYILMLCNLGYISKRIKAISGENFACPGAPDASLVRNLNYPALGVKVKPLEPFNVRLTRTVTNVGLPNSIYKAIIIQKPQINITVAPEILSFKSLNEKQTFVVTITGKIPNQTVITSSLVWSDGTHNVRSPIVVSDYTRKQ
ncbi:subtilisin-like protease SBT4.3 [Abrus precatorius]|uniref:Subtilisin-like protease SBT4.3 n=1 Tax=Abrus precatorius TaxID=3816 RepID=A0A8B8KN82_ABRPR|nr:subtilisin-like protease SBT4.3 [Abrus precatorius]